MAASGINTRDAALLLSHRLDLISGKRNYARTKQEIRGTRSSLRRWGGTSSYYGSARLRTRALWKGESSMLCRNALSLPENRSNANRGVMKNTFEVITFRSMPLAFPDQPVPLNFAENSVIHFKETVKGRPYRGLLSLRISLGRIVHGK